MSEGSKHKGQPEAPSRQVHSPQPALAVAEHSALCSRTTYPTTGQEALSPTYSFIFETVLLCSTGWSQAYNPLGSASQMLRTLYLALLY